MSNHLHQAGSKFLKLLGRHSDLIMDAYLSGSVNETEVDPKAIEKLSKANVLWRPDVEQELRLTGTVRSMLENALSDERNRQIDANSGSALATIKTLANHYKEARHNVDHAAAEAYLNDLNEHVYAFTESLAYSTRVLWSRINNEFGYVGTINAKIRENELAQSQVTELLNGLEMFQFDELTEIAGDIRELRKLMVTTLQEALSQSIEELSLVQSRLLELLGRFRHIQGRTRLLKGWLLHQDMHPEYSPESHASHKTVPSLFNHAAAILKPAAVDVRNTLHETELMQLVAKVKSFSDRPQTQTAHEDLSITLEDTVAFDITESQLKLDVDQYFCDVIDSGVRQSALEYLRAQDLNWDAESWIYQVIGGYEGLPEEQKHFFELEPLGESHPIYNGNFIIKDVELWLA
ncbi:phosphoenolpyruvate carboxylase [Parashewanella curva]|uniref:Phosphoenolpyruvate carboxylase n=1 Tax=Parashewanella curva TaxID=2338552 RepID=A0A3L8PZQ3_9GAMM|nr:phosphoenolpyruvate carboxylase [Parashewanella curva]RLV59572.1 phosphoenolpyruvate carboxylase [Parashewanella curva]